MSERVSYADEHGNSVEKPILFLDRVLGAALAFVGGLVTLAFGPFMILMTAPSWVAFRHPYFSWQMLTLFAWGIVWLVPAAIAGWIAGFPRVLTVFAHLWFTADPPNRQLSHQLWSGISVIVVVTSFAILIL